MEKKILARDLSFNYKLTIDWPKESKVSTLKCALIAMKSGVGGKLPTSLKALEVNSNCISTKLCVKACPMSAVSYDENDGIEFDNDKCFGCFVCANACPKQAIGHTSKTMTSIIDNVQNYQSRRKEVDLYM